jgi:hypothetical protein
MLIDINGDGLADRVFDSNPKTDPSPFISINIEFSPFAFVGRFFQLSPRLACHCLPANLGDNWKNRPTNANGENSMLIDINGDGLPDRVFDRNPEVDDQPGLFMALSVVTDEMT